MEDDDDDIDNEFLNMCGNISNHTEFMSNDEMLFEFQSSDDLMNDSNPHDGATELTKRRKRDDGILSSPTVPIE